MPLANENMGPPGTSRAARQEALPPGSEPSAAVTLRFVGWRDLTEDDDGSGGEAGRRFQFIGEFDGDGVPNWPMGWFFNAKFHLSPDFAEAEGQS